MATFVVRTLDRPGEICGIVRDVSTGAIGAFTDPDELVALLRKRIQPSDAPQRRAADPAALEKSGRGIAPIGTSWAEEQGRDS